MNPHRWPGDYVSLRLVAPHSRPRRLPLEPHSLSAGREYAPRDPRSVAAPQAGMEVLVIGDDAAPALGTPDPEVPRWIEREGYILVSRNGRTLSQHLQRHLEDGGHVPGILLLGRRSFPGEIVEDLLLMWELARPEEYGDRVQYLPL